MEKTMEETAAVNRTSFTIRMKLLVNLGIILLVTVTVFVLSVRWFQQSRLGEVETRLAEVLDQTGQSLTGNLTQVGVDIEAAVTEGFLGRYEAIAEVLATVAPTPMLAKDYQTLVSYVQKVNESPDVVYVLFYNDRGKPVTRYLDKEKPLVAELLEADSDKKGKINRLLDAASRRSDLIKIDKPLMVEAQEIGRLVLCMSNASARAKIEAVAAQMDRAVTEAREANTTLLGDTHQGFTELKSRTQEILWILGAGALLAIGCLTALIVGRITRPLKGLVDMLKDIAEGEADLTRRIEIHQNDEIGELARWFNRFVETTRGLIAEVASTSLELASIAEQLAASSQQIVSSNGEVSAQAQSSASAAEQMNVTVQDVVGNVESVSQSSSDARKVATEGAAVIAKAAAAMATITETVNDAADRAQRLGEESQNIGMVIEVIEDIADQTNLLALNAAIEAARAGEHGRGFAVVADEVRKLAEKTVNATREIANTVKSIQTESTVVVEAMARGQAEASQGAELARDTGAAIDNIESRVARSDDQTTQIASAMEEMAATIRDMTGNMDRIAQGVDQNNVAAQQTAETIATVAAKADTLRSLTGRFRT